MPSKTVLVSGHFNVIHPGHLRLFRFAKECGSRLIVAVENDGLAGDAAHVPEHLRLEGVVSNAYVDVAFLTHEPIGQVIEKWRPDIVVKGKEHEHRHNPEAEAVARYGGQLIFSSGETVFSSLDLIRREFVETVPNSIVLPHDFMARHAISHARLRDLLAQFSKLKVVVVGDLIVDEYITCQPLGMSQEDPTVVVTPIDSVQFIGGAGIVAAHAAGLGATVTFISVTGVDEARDFSVNKLKSFHVQAELLEDASRPTTLKKRFRSKGKSLLRVSHLHQGAVSAELQEQMFASIRTALEDADLLVFSDFNYGALPQPLVDRIVEFACSRKILLAADSQSSSQVGDIGRFRGMDLITPTEREARLSVRNQEDGLVVLAEKLRQQANATNVLLKMGEEGLLIHAGGVQEGNFLTDQVPALNKHAKDVAGAGDSLLIAAAMAMALGANIWEASFLGSLAAAIQVGRVGNTPLQTSQLLQELTQ
jgi:rfaE bifunctional protein kinase chain/domain